MSAKACLIYIVVLVMVTAIIVIPIMLTRPSAEPEEVYLNESVVIPSLFHSRLSWFNIHNNTVSTSHSYTSIDTILARIPKKAKVTFYTHGFCMSGSTKTSSDYTKLKNRLLGVEKRYRPDIVILIDWSWYCDGTTPYGIFTSVTDALVDVVLGNPLIAKIHGFHQAVKNSDIISKEIAHVIYHIVRYNRVDPSNIHMIGHSLGATMMAKAAWRLTKFYGFYKKVGRITGIDPAYPKGMSYLCDVLEQTDAQFVDIIHTDTVIFARLPAVARGHVDFFANGGHGQPGCWIPSCSHSRAFDLFSTSLLDVCHFGSNCHSDTRHCVDGVRMGFYAIETPTARGNYYISTTGDYPYCYDRRFRK